MEKHKRIRTNKRMMAWSDGQRVHIIPSVFRQVDNYGRLMADYHYRIDEGYLIDMGSSAMAREESQIREYEADRSWEQGRHFEALREMLRAAMFVLPDDEPEFEDVQWLNPEETLYWHPNVREFLRLIRRCRDYCRQEPRLWPYLEGDYTYRRYCKYLEDLGRWVHDA